MIIHTEKMQDRQKNRRTLKLARFSLISASLIFVILLSHPVLQVSSVRTFPVALEEGDAFVYQVFDDHVLVSINKTTFLDRTYLVEPTSEVQVSVTGIKNVTEDYANWGILTIINQSEVMDSGKTRETFSYVNGWLDIYHFGLLSAIYVFGFMLNAPHAYSFEYVEPLIQDPQVGLPVFTSTNGTYFEELMAANPPTDNDNQTSGGSGGPGATQIPPYELSYKYNGELGQFVMNHTMVFKTNGTLQSDNTTTWSLDLKMDFFLNTTFSKSIVNELKTIVYWSARVGNASHEFDWGLHVKLKNTQVQNHVTSELSAVSTTLPVVLVVVSLGISSATLRMRRKNPKSRKCFNHVASAIF